MSTGISLDKYIRVYRFNF